MKSALLAGMGACALVALPLVAWAGDVPSRWNDPQVLPASLDLEPPLQYPSTSTPAAPSFLSAPVAPLPGEPAPGIVGCPQYDGDCGPGLIRRWREREPWTLPQSCTLSALGIKSGGWLQGGITGNSLTPADRSNGPVLTNDRSNEFMLNEAWLYFDRPVKTDGCGWGLGGRVDLFYGTDWRVADAFSIGLENRINGRDQLYGLALPQFYAEVGVNRLSVKLGRMAGIMGYEVVPPIGNFFYSHSYAIAYSEPVLITGLLARYQLCEHWALLGGVHQGWGRFEDNNEDKNLIAGIIWDHAETGTSVAYSLDAGRNDPAGLRDQFVQSLVFKQQLSERLLYVLQSDMGFLDEGAGQQAAQWYGANQYLLYTINACWSAGMRAEWFRDDDGTRVAGLGNINRGWMAPGGYAGDFYELTLGLNWKPKANVLFRPEVRYDWYNGPAAPTTYPLPFGDGLSRDQLTYGADLVITF